MKPYARITRNMDWNERMQGEKERLEKTDAAVIQECISGNVNRYEILVDRYQKRVYNLCYRLVGNTEDAKDMTQEAFVKAYQSLHQYNPQYAFGSWIFRIAHNLSIDYLRKKTRRQEFSMTGTMDKESESEESETIQRDWPDQSPNVRTGLMEKQEKEKLEQIIQSLPEQYKSVILLRHMEELSIDEIAKILDLPSGTVKIHLFRARNLIREKWSQVL